MHVAVSQHWLPQWQTNMLKFPVSIDTMHFVERSGSEASAITLELCTAGNASRIIPRAGILFSYNLFYVIPFYIYFSLLIIDNFVEYFTVSGTMYFTCILQFYPLKIPWDIGTIIISILHIKKLRSIAVNWLLELREFVSGSELGKAEVWPWCGLYSEPVLSTLYSAISSWVLWNTGVISSRTFKHCTRASVEFWDAKIFWI